MDSKFKANGVLASAVDFFCLVCESRLYNGIDAVAHIGKPVHTKNFELTHYFENKDDYVRKIKKWYFCELCNLLLSTATKVRLHVTEVSHVEYRNQRLVERNGKFIVAYSNVKIHDNAWNGIIDETCVLCNTEFENEKIHINETTHIIKLIQSKTEFDANKNVYRKIDDSSLQCLTCNVVFAISLVDAHFNLLAHIKSYQEAINSVEDKTLQNNKKANKVKEVNLNNKENKDLNNKENKGSEKETTSSVTENIIKKNVPNGDEGYQTKNAKYDTVNNKENTEKVVKTPVTEINTSTRNLEYVDGECRNKIAKVVKKSDKEICEILNAKNYITQHKEQALWCILCQWELNPSAVKSHTSDIHHQTLLKLHKKRLSKLNTNEITSLKENITMGQDYKTNAEIYQEGVSILDSIEKFHQNGIQINFEIHTAFCVKCSSSLKFNKALIEDHIKTHAKNLKANDIYIKKDNETNEQNTEEDDSILDWIENFQQNNIQINFEIQTAFCKKCATSLDLKKICIENHIEEHKKALKSNDKIEQPDSTMKLSDEQVGNITDSQYYQKNNVLVNFDLRTVYCKKCSIPLDCNKTFIDNHIKEHSKTFISEKKKTKVSQATSGNENRKTKNTSNKKASVHTTPAAKKKNQAKEPLVYTEEEVKNIAELLDMTYTPNSKEVHCKTCNTNIPSFPKNITEHVAGNAHKINLGKSDPSTDKNKIILQEPIKPINLKTVEATSFVSSFVTIEGSLSKDIVLNHKICLNVYSFGLVVKNDNMLICQICNTCEHINQFDQHLDSPKHSKFVNESLVVDDGDEFIREVQSKGYHCGYCNIFESSWESLQNHLESFAHRDSKTAGQWRLQQYMPYIQKHAVEDVEVFGYHLIVD